MSNEPPILPQRPKRSGRGVLYAGGLVVLIMLVAVFGSRDPAPARRGISAGRDSAERDIEWHPSKISTVAIGFFTDPTTIAMARSGLDPTAKPVVGAVYSLYEMRMVQKVPGGYLMQFAMQVGELAHLQTDASLPENFAFMDANHFCEFTGELKYEAMNGFERSIYSFRMLSDQENAKVNAALAAAKKGKGF